MGGTDKDIPNPVSKEVGLVVFVLACGEEGYQQKPAGGKAILRVAVCEKNWGVPSSANAGNVLKEKGKGRWHS